MSVFNDFPHTRNSDQDFGWLIKAYRDLDEVVEQITQGNAELQKEIQELNNKVDDFINGGFAEKYLDVLEKWIAENIGKIFPTVWFGIDKNGYFIALIPNGWDNVIFNTTGLDIHIENVDYGHLTLSTGGNKNG